MSILLDLFVVPFSGPAQRGHGGEGDGRVSSFISLETVGSRGGSRSDDPYRQHCETKRRGEMTVAGGEEWHTDGCQSRG